jgi:electron transfer flavoprotein alpha subunit
MFYDIWIWVQHREGTVEEASFGLINEARRLISQLGGEGTITAVAMGTGLEESELKLLGAYGAQKVLCTESDSLARYQGELFAGLLFDGVSKNSPACILMAQTPETADLSARLGALMETTVISRAMDFSMDPDGSARAIRPVSNGYLFERVTFDCKTPPVISFLPAVLTAEVADPHAEITIQKVALTALPGDPKTKVIDIIEAAPEDLDIEEADIIVAGGRGVGKDEAFNIIHDLARAIGGSVGATRPIIDWQTLPFERQIGQTGKTVSPRLIINCGISGANEYTAGIEKSQFVIAIDLNPRARIFRFADLGVIGDVHEVLPPLISRLEEMKKEA